MRFKCYDCGHEFDQDREPGEYAKCPYCGSLDIVERDSEESGAS